MQRERGFSLAEIMVAFLILTVVITVSLTAFLQRNKRLQQASELVLVYQALANEAEYQRRVPWSQLVSSNQFQSNTDILAPLESPGTVVTVQLVKPDVKDVTLTVRWMNGARVARLGLKRVRTGGSNLW